MGDEDNCSYNIDNNNNNNETNNNDNADNHSNFVSSPLNDSIRRQGLVPVQLNGAGGQCDGARGGLVGWGGSQGVERTHRTLTTALADVQNRHFSCSIIECTTTVSWQK